MSVNAIPTPAAREPGPLATRVRSRAAVTDYLEHRRTSPNRRTNAGP
jgi:hypothetical protein